MHRSSRYRHAGSQIQHSFTVLEIQSNPITANGITLNVKLCSCVQNWSSAFNVDILFTVYGEKSINYAADCDHTERDSSVLALPSLVPNLTKKEAERR